MLATMIMRRRRTRLSILLASMLAVACATAKQAEKPTRPEPASAAGQPTLALPAASSLYPPEEALRDALSGPWEYVGTGPWPGIERIQACAFRNQRVLVVNVYCTPKETQAFRIDVYSPARGHVRIYAESKGVLSARARRDYFTFMAESEPPPDPVARMSPLSLALSFDELRAYDEQRYRASLPACYGGHELSRRRGSCMGALAARSSEWADRNRSFLEYANDDWYRVVREMRSLSARYGKEPD
jgi:hypothetical protein